VHVAAANNTDDIPSLDDTFVRSALPQTPPSNASAESSTLKINATRLAEIPSQNAPPSQGLRTEGGSVTDPGWAVENPKPRPFTLIQTLLVRCVLFALLGLYLLFVCALRSVVQGCMAFLAQFVIPNLMKISFPTGMALQLRQWRDQEYESRRRTVSSSSSSSTHDDKSLAAAASVPDQANEKSQFKTSSTNAFWFILLFKSNIQSAIVPCLNLFFVYRLFYGWSFSILDTFAHAYVQVFGDHPPSPEHPGHYHHHHQFLEQATISNLDDDSILKMLTPVVNRAVFWMDLLFGMHRFWWTIFLVLTCILSYAIVVIWTAYFYHWYACKWSHWHGPRRHERAVTDISKQPNAKNDLTRQLQNSYDWKNLNSITHMFDTSSSEKGPNPPVSESLLTKFIPLGALKYTETPEEYHRIVQQSRDHFERISGQPFDSIQNSSLVANLKEADFKSLGPKLWPNPETRPRWTMRKYRLYAKACIAEDCKLPSLANQNLPLRWVVTWMQHAIEIFTWFFITSTSVRYWLWSRIGQVPKDGHFVCLLLIQYLEFALPNLDSLFIQNWIPRRFAHLVDIQQFQREFGNWISFEAKEGVDFSSKAHRDHDDAFWCGLDDVMIQYLWNPGLFWRGADQKVVCQVLIETLFSVADAADGAMRSNRAKPPKSSKIEIPASNSIPFHSIVFESSFLWRAIEEPQA
jgi:hypothetical protein